MSFPELECAASGVGTLSSLFCQLSSRLTISSMQWDRVERIPAVVALKVMASPLKSMPFMALGLAGENTGGEEESKSRTTGFLRRLKMK